MKTLLSQAPGAQGRKWSFSTLLVFMIISSLFWSGGAPSGWLSASREQVFRGHQYWRLFTTLGVHEDLFHFGSNSLFFVIFGYLLNGYFGVLVFPVLSLLLGAMTNLAVLYFYPSNSVLIGASGMVYAMAGFWITLYCFIERQKSAGSRLLRAAGVVLALFVPQEFQAHVSYLAHAFGFLAGIFSGSVYFVASKNRLRSFEKTDEEGLPSLIALGDEFSPLRTGLS